MVVIRPKFLIILPRKCPIIRLPPRRAPVGYKGTLILFRGLLGGGKGGTAGKRQARPCCWDEEGKWIKLEYQEIRQDSAMFWP